ncbi:TetR/AcrR family transcriptional regulator [Gemmatimonas groenlandica]|uniref:TetR/AcrR family transcriptional regulator n=1 Tax=Gemmatimonas groenlandica TaxID=2732249 RepID=A0A6M4IUQ2_9BACT|nr:TetR/AcrR family transcriptional regulator [Gemmatimonas groenlandica]QJR37925.1 TetR/AcrR family transcriptional regulator [Gemmatimonas groenlandica]
MVPFEIEGDGPSRRRLILAEATRIFLEKGFSATAMSEVAKASGIQKASLYHHFPSKEALFVACATNGFADALADLEAIRNDPDLGDDDRLRRAVDAVYRINLDSACGQMAPLIAEVSRTIPTVARAFYEGFIYKQHIVMGGIIDDGLARGSFVTRERLGLEQMIFGPIVSLALEREMFAAFDDVDAVRPVDQIREEHATLLLRLMKGDTETTRATRVPKGAP